MNLFDCGLPLLKIGKPIRLIELFAGVGSQAKALERLGAPFEHHRICEFDKYAVASYNAIHGTDFETSDITKIHADDLAVTETDKYCYILTYSFPCQDLSNAGKQAGMTKGSGTRSGLLWEVERLLNEMDELPQILLMENVPAVVGEKNKPDFIKWVQFLSSRGYTNKWEILNAKDFGIPQNRERCFMVSFLGEYAYEFPQGFPLKLRLKDVLEDQVDEKYYIKGEAADRLCSQLLKVEREREADKAVRAGGHGSLDRHAWDTVLCQSQRSGTSDRCSSHAMRERLQGLDGQKESKQRGRLQKNVQIIDPQGRKSKEVKPRDDCPTLRAQTHGNVPMVVGGIYLQATEDYQRGILHEMSRTIKAVQHDAGVVLSE